MVMFIKYNNISIKYNLTQKNVKNINLRIKPDGTVNVSANSLVPQRVINEFILSKAEYILKAVEKYKNKANILPHQYFSEAEIKDVIYALCKRAYPYFEAKGVKYPQIKFASMRSRWGSCNPQKGILKFNTNLMYAPQECVNYVVLHEFTHFLQPNHSKRFYEELEKICPLWKLWRKKLKLIIIP